MVLAASFRGDAAENEARELADELRQRHGLTVYIHDRAFDYSDENPGRGLDDYGAPIRRRYQTEAVREVAVLVGEFASIDDPEAQRVLEKIKSMPSTAIRADDDDVDSDAGQFRQLSNSLLGKIGAQKQRGPMAKAFLTRNPLLPREYFVPNGIDPFVAKMNRGVEHSLLECPGKYTVQVATFRGKSLLQPAGAKADSSGFGKGWRKDKDNPLIEAAENAHLLAEELRANDWDAYEFHDRTESIVTIGSFDQAAQRLADGQVTPTPQVAQIIQTFGAAYNTPADPLTGDDVRSQRRATELKQQFNQMLTNNHGQVTASLNPKHVKIMRRNKIERVIPIDVYPHVIEVPRASISSSYTGW
jgi:hypothetical protein